MRKKEYIIFIESNTSGTGEIYAKLAKVNGFRPVLFTKNPGLYSYELKNEVILRKINTLDIKAITNEANELMNTGKIRGVTSSSDYFVGMAAQLAYLLGMPCNHPESIELTRNKYLSRMLLLQSEIAIPNFIRVDNTIEIKAACNKIGFPLVVKPVLGSGSQDVRFFSNANGIEEYSKKLLAKNENPRGQKIPQYFLIEQYLEGDEYSVEAFGDGKTIKVVGITKKYTGAFPYFVETGHDFPASLNEIEKLGIEHITHKVLKASNLMWGPMHLEVICTTDQDIKIIEVNPRLAGGMIPKLIKYATGLDLVSEHIQLMTGGRISLTTNTTEFSSIRFLVPPANGRIEVINLEEAKSSPGIQEAIIYARFSNFKKLYGDFRDRLGHLISTGPSVNLNRNQIDIALSKVEYKYAS